jgi:phage gp36-like protein
MARYLDSTGLLAGMPPYLQIQLFDDDHDGTADAAAIEAVCEASCDEADIYISEFATVPLTGAQISGGIKLCVRDIAWFRAHERIGRNSDLLQQRYEQVLERLGMIARMELGTGGATPPDPAPTRRYLLASEAKMFGRTNHGRLA